MRSREAANIGAFCDTLSICGSNEAIWHLPRPRHANAFVLPGDVKREDDTISEDTTNSCGGERATAWMGVRDFRGAERGDCAWLLNMACSLMSGGGVRGGLKCSRGGWRRLAPMCPPMWLFCNSFRLFCRFLAFLGPPGPGPLNCYTQGDQCMVTSMSCKFIFFAIHVVCILANAILAKHILI